jgi:hypothetical protein
MPNVFAKVSGLDAGKADHWTAAAIAPYIDRALELFGPERLMFGSDWPVANLRGGYSKVWRETNLAFTRLSVEERDRSWVAPPSRSIGCRSRLDRDELAQMRGERSCPIGQLTRGNPRIFFSRRAVSKSEIGRGRTCFCLRSRSIINFVRNARAFMAYLIQFGHNAFQ